MSLGSHTLLLRPREGHDLRIASSSLNIFPQASVTWRRDFYDNVPAVAVFSGNAVLELVVESRVEAELYDTMPLDFVVAEHAVRFPFEYEGEERIALRPCLEFVYGNDSRFADWLAPFRHPATDTETFAILDRLNQQIHTSFCYEVREQEGVLPPAELLQAQREKARRELDRKIRENELAIARNEARIEAIHECALADVALREAVRMALRAKVLGAVSGHYVNGEAILTPPDGLPDGMTNEDVNAAILAGLGGGESDA